MAVPEKHIEQLRWLFTRLPDTCIFETDATGIITHYGADAETLFGYPASKVVDTLHYANLHDPIEMEACQNDPEFMRTVEQNGFVETDWTVLPSVGDTFRCRVTLLPLVRLDTERAKGDNTRRGWLALYRKL